MRDPPTRRRLLRAAGVAGLAGVAGCSSDGGSGIFDGNSGGDGDDGDDEDDGNDGDDDGGGPAYAAWLYEPGTVLDAEHYGFSYLEAGPFRRNAEEFDADTYEQLSSVNRHVDRVGLTFADLGWQLSFQRSTVATGDFSVEEVEAELEGAGYDDEEEVDGYVVWVDGDGRSAYGVAERAIVHGRAGIGEDATAAEVVERTVGTARGDEDRYREASEDFATLASELGDGALVQGSTQEEGEGTNVETGQFEGKVAGGSTLTVDGATTRVDGVLVFADASDVDLDDVEEYVEAQKDAGTDFVGDAESVDVGRDGRVVLIRITLDTDEI